MIAQMSRGDLSGDMMRGSTERGSENSGPGARVHGIYLANSDTEFKGGTITLGEYRERNYPECEPELYRSWWRR